MEMYRGNSLGPLYYSIIITQFDSLYRRFIIIHKEHSLSGDTLFIAYT